MEANSPYLSHAANGSTCRTGFSSHHPSAFLRLQHSAKLSNLPVQGTTNNFFFNYSEEVTMMVLSLFSGTFLLKENSGIHTLFFAFMSAPAFSSTSMPSESPSSAALSSGVFPASSCSIAHTIMHAYIASKLALARDKTETIVPALQCSSNPVL